MSELKSYSATDIHRYLQHEMNAGEMHAFEKAMMDDPFLADAIEGYKQSDTTLADQHLLDIERDLKRAEEKRKVVVMPSRNNSWWKVAAVLLLVVTGALGYLIWNRSAPKEASQIAQTKEQEKAEAQGLGLTDAGTLPDQRTLQAPALESKEVLTSKRAATANRDNDKADDKGSNEMLAMREEVKERADVAQAPANKVFEADSMRLRQEEIINGALKMTRRPIAASQSEIKPYADSNKSLPQTQSVATTVNQGLQGRAAGVDANSKIRIRGSSSLPGESMLNQFRGKVTDAKGQPVTGATVSAPKLNIITATDSLGYFNITAPERNTDVVVNSVGFVGATAKINSDLASNNIILKQNSNNLNEVVVVGYGSQKRKDVTGSVSTVNKEYLSKVSEANVNQAIGDTNYIAVVPRGGWKNFNDYVNRAMASIKDTLGRTDVVLEFSIDKRGHPSDIKMVKAGNRADGLEAIRILKNGPLWNSKNKSARVAYSFNFKR